MPAEAAANQKTAAGPGPPDPEELLKAANTSSERLAGMHLAFMAVCAYVLVIVFGTTHLDLLLGKGVKLPVVNVDVPIFGFYAFTPFLIVLVHFNLLLQLQLLSRKLFAFDAAAPPGTDIGSLRDRLHIFPYTYYLVGRPSPVVRPLLALMVSITLVVLPFATLLALQLEFLAYQSQVVTWCQRLAVWLDVAVIAVLWPLIMHPADDWRGHWRELLAAHVPRPAVWLAFALLLAGAVMFLFGVPDMAVLAGLVLLLLAVLSVTPLRGWRATPRALKIIPASLAAAAVLALAIAFLIESALLVLLLLVLLGLLLFLCLPLALLWHPRAPRGSLALLLTLFVGVLLPPALLVDGEGLERLVLRLQPAPEETRISTFLADKILKDKRRLVLVEQVLLAKPPPPETLAQIRSDQWPEGVKRIEPLNLKDRSLRHAQMFKVILSRADLRQAQLQGADLLFAQLQGANLLGAQLQGADLAKAQLQGAILWSAQLQGAKMFEAQLQGAILWSAQLQGADLLGAQLQGADLYKAQLQGADLGFAQLQGANLLGAQLQGADLAKAQLQGADLRYAWLYSLGVPENADLLDAREVVWEPLPDDAVRKLSQELQTVIKDQERHRRVLDRLKEASASSPPLPKLQVQSCLAGSQSPLACQKRYDPGKPPDLAAFKNQLHAVLADLACTDPWIAQGLLRQIPKDPQDDSSRQGLGAVLRSRLDDPKCPGLQGLSPEMKNKLRDLK